MDEKPSSDNRAARTVTSRDELIEWFAGELHAGVARFDGREVPDFNVLPDDRKASWRRAAEHAFESTVDRIIEAGRPVWWVES